MQHVPYRPKHRPGMLGKLPSSISKGHHFCNCFLPTGNYSIATPFPKDDWIVAVLAHNSQSKPATKCQITKAWHLSLSARSRPHSKSWPPPPYSSQTILVSNQTASPGSLCSANTSTKPSLPPAPLPIICSLHNTAAQPKSICLDVVSNSQPWSPGSGFGVSSVCELPGAEARLCVPCLVPPAMGSGQRQGSPCMETCCSSLPQQPPGHTGSRQCCNLNKKAASSWHIRQKTAAEDQV